MADSEYILMKLVAPIMGFILANVMFFSGVPGMLRCKRLGGLGDMNPLPFPVVLANCISWIIYSILIEDYFLFFSNAPGAMVGMYFTLVAYGLSAYKSKMRDALEAWLMSMMFGLLALTLYVGEGSEKGGVGGNLIFIPISNLNARPLSPTPGSFFSRGSLRECTLPSIQPSSRELSRLRP